MPEKTDPVREQVLYLLGGGGAHQHLEDILEGLPVEFRGKRPEALPYSPWELLEQMRLAQHDILQFSVDPAWESPAWPDGYWPDTPAPANDGAWDASVAAFREDLQRMQNLVADDEADLYTPFPHGDGQNLLREALLVADHNAYHLGQMVTVRRALGAWE